VKREREVVEVGEKKQRADKWTPLMRVYLSFQPSVNKVNSISQNRGNCQFWIQKTGVNMQSPKNKGKCVVENQNDSGYAIAPPPPHHHHHKKKLKARSDFPAEEEAFFHVSMVGLVHNPSGPCEKGRKSFTGQEC
jgi:hypothetical protein